MDKQTALNMVGPSSSTSSSSSTPTTSNSSSTPTTSSSSSTPSTSSSAKHGTFSKIPKGFLHRQNLINLRSVKGNQCFKNSFLTSSHFFDVLADKKNPHALSSYKKYEQLYYGINDMADATLKMIKSFAKKNNISIKIFEIIEDKYRVVQHFNKKETKIVNILRFLINVKTSTYHLVGIKDIELISNNRFRCGTYKKVKQYQCSLCNKKFVLEKSLKKHEPFCSGKGSQLLFSKDEKSNYLDCPKAEKSLPPPFSIYYDFETCRIFSDTNCKFKKCKHSKNEDGICNQATLVPITCSAVIVIKNRQILDSQFFFGSDCSDNFLKYLLEKEEFLIEEMSKYVSLIFSEEEEKKHNEAILCDYCDIFFSLSDKARLKTRHHCHYTGRYIGAYCATCNLSAKQKSYIPCYAHNGSSFDTHLIFQSFVKNQSQFKDVEIECLTKNSEKFKTFSLNSFQFIDTLSFFNCSLDKLAKTETDLNKFVVTQQSPYIKKNDPNYDKKLKYLTVKPSFPYDYLSFETIYSVKFPSKENFYNSLTDQHITDEEYEKSLEMYNLFECKNFLDYVKLYNFTDVYLLADLFLNFCDCILTNFKISPQSKFISISQLSYDCMRLYVYEKNFRPRTYTFDDKLFMEETYNMIRGGQTLINRRAEISSNLENELFFKMNSSQKLEYLELKKNIYLDSVKKQGKKLKFKCSKKGCNQYMFSENVPKHEILCAEHETVTCLYLDRTALYSEAMCLPMPYSDYEILNDDEIRTLNYNFKNLSLDQLDKKFPDNAEVGYILVVDLQVPKNVQDKICEYPPLMQKEIIKNENLSPYSQNMYKKLFGDQKKSSEKMISSVSDKQNYFIAIRNLKFLLKLGVKLKVISKGYSFIQKPWLAPYVNHLIFLRKNAKSDFEKSLFKLMSNSIFGKFLTNIYQFLDSRFITCPEKFFLYQSLGDIKDFVIHSETLLQIFRAPPLLFCGRPRIIGSMILENAKLIMYQFVFDVLMKRFDSPRVLYGDTDSVIISVKNVSFEQALKTLEDTLDTTNIKSVPSLKNSKRYGDLGYFKSETQFNEVSLFTGLRKKCYLYECSNEIFKVMKGVKKSNFKDVALLDFLECLLNFKEKNLNFYSILSKKHIIYHSEQTKLALSPFDDSNFYMDCGICANRYGHYLNSTSHCNNLECQKVKFLLNILYSTLKK